MEDILLITLDPYLFVLENIVSKIKDALIVELWFKVNLSYKVFLFFQLKYECG